MLIASMVMFQTKVWSECSRDVLLKLKLDVFKLFGVNLASVNQCINFRSDSLPCQTLDGFIFDLIFRECQSP